MTTRRARSSRGRISVVSAPLFLHLSMAGVRGHTRVMVARAQTVRERAQASEQARRLGGLLRRTRRQDFFVVPPRQRLRLDAHLRREIHVLVVSESPQEEWVKGTYVGVCDGALILWNETGEHAIALEAIREVRVPEGTYAGSGLATGLFVGVLLDLAVVVAIFGGGGPSFGR